MSWWVTGKLVWFYCWCNGLTHWGRVTHICVSKLTIIGSDNGLSPGRRQAIIWTNAWILLIWTLGTNFSEIISNISCIFIQENAFENVIWKKAAILSGPQCVKTELGLPQDNEMKVWNTVLSWTGAHLNSRPYFPIAHPNKVCLQHMMITHSSHVVRPLAMALLEIFHLLDWVKDLY